MRRSTYENHPWNFISKKAYFCIFCLWVLLLISFASAESIFPKFNGWYCGDTHYHTDYTNVNGELGWSISDTSRNITNAGLDFFFVTDHSNSIKHWGGKSIWEDFKKECNRYPNCLIGNEINCDYTKRAFLDYTEEGNHLLAYDYSSYIDDGSQVFLASGTINVPDSSFPTINTPSCEEVINNVTSQGGFTYAAHPTSEYDILGINIISPWKDYDLLFTGLEIWNGDIKDQEIPPGYTKTKGEIREKALEDGLEEWKNIILGGRHVYISGGTDTHGAKDSSPFASVATCINAETYSKSKIIDAFKNGKSYITNNGALIMEAWSFTNTGEWAPTVSVGIAEEITVCEKISFHLDFNYDIEIPCTIKIYEGDIENKREMPLPEEVVLSGKKTSIDWNGIVKYDFPSEKVYYRAECKSTDGKSRIYTNPIWVNVDREDSDNDGSCDTYDMIDNIAPTNNRIITKNTIFDYGEYLLSDGITIIADDIFIDCQNSSLIGIEKPGSVGVTINGKNITLKNCIIKNYGKGIELMGLGDHIIENNLIYDNVFGIAVEVGSPGESKVTNNDIFNNKQKNIYNSLDAIVNAENNWWGTANETKIEEKIHPGSGLVNYVPFKDKSNVKITAELDPSTLEVIAGEQIIIISTLKNTGEIETTYTLSLYENSDWSDLIEINPQTITLNPGESRDISIILDLDDDAEGQKEFTIKATYLDKITEQKIAMTIENPKPLDLIKHVENNTIQLKDGDNIIIEFDATNDSTDLTNLFIRKQSNESNFSYMLIKGLDLISQNKTKTVYLDKILDGSRLCIKDKEITSISEISNNCKGTDEFLLECPGTNGDYSCELNGVQYKISGLKHSGIKEQETYCGDSSCNGGETCSSCLIDCGNCPTYSYCGDGTCDDNEDCSSCSTDCGCSSEYKCSSGVCKKKKSSSSSSSSSSSNLQYFTDSSSDNEENKTENESEKQIILLGGSKITGAVTQPFLLNNQKAGFMITFLFLGTLITIVMYKLKIRKNRE